MTETSVPSPGGWAQLLNARLTRWLVIGALATTGGAGALVVYGDFQGAQAVQYVETKLTTTTANTVVSSTLNPLPAGESGSIVFDEDTLLFVSESAAPTTRVSICTSTGAAQPCTRVSGGSNIMSGVYLTGTNRTLFIGNTGGIVTVNAPAIVAPRDYGTAARKFINITFTTGTGQTTSGLASAFARIKVMPCNLDGVGC